MIERRSSTSGAPRWPLLERADAAAGPLPPELLLALRTELERAAAVVAARERAAPPEPSVAEGSHALLALLAARAGRLRREDQLIGVAAAVELAHRATCHHAAIVDRGLGSAEEIRRLNRRRVLDGDWSITQAALLAADVGPAAYRILVRGYGAAEVSPLRGGSPPATAAGPQLAYAALALGALVAGVACGDAGAEPATLDSAPPAPDLDCWWPMGGQVRAIVQWLLDGVRAAAVSPVMVR